MFDDFGRVPSDDYAAPPSGGESDIDSVASVDQDDLSVTQPVELVAVEPVPVEPPLSLMDRLFGRGRSRRRLHDLSNAIDLHPDSPTNYVLRGELYLNVGEAALAEADFRQALSLAQADYGTSRWGVVAQAVQDRARAGLTKAHGRI